MVIHRHVVSVPVRDQERASVFYQDRDCSDTSRPVWPVWSEQSWAPRHPRPTELAAASLAAAAGEAAVRHRRPLGAMICVF